MRLKFISLMLLVFSHSAFAQVPASSQNSLLGFFIAKEFSKEMALYNGKTFVMNEVLGKPNNVLRFQIDPLVASNSGELTTLVYRCEIKNKEGLILGFYGNRWNDAGVNYQAYAFKDYQLMKPMN